MPLIFALMLFVVILAFRSPLQAFAVFALIPFGLVGISLGHWFLGAQISLFSILGLDRLDRHIGQRRARYLWRPSTAT